MTKTFWILDFIHIFKKPSTVSVTVIVTTNTKTNTNYVLLCTKTGYNSSSSYHNISYNIENYPYEYFLYTQLVNKNTSNLLNEVILQGINEEEVFVYSNPQDFTITNCSASIGDETCTSTNNVIINFSTQISDTNSSLTSGTYSVSITTTIPVTEVNCASSSGSYGEINQSCLDTNTTYKTTYSFSNASSSTTPVTIEIYTEYNGSRLVPTKINYTYNDTTTDQGMLTSPIAFLCNMFYGISYDSYINQSSGGNQTGNNEAHSIENCIIIQQMLAPLYTNFISTIK